ECRKHLLGDTAFFAVCPKGSIRKRFPNNLHLCWVHVIPGIIAHKLERFFGLWVCFCDPSCRSDKLVIPCDLCNVVSKTVCHCHIGHNATCFSLCVQVRSLSLKVIDRWNSFFSRLTRRTVSKS